MESGQPRCRRGKVKYGCYFFLVTTDLVALGAVESFQKMLSNCPSKTLQSPQNVQIAHRVLTGLCEIPHNNFAKTQQEKEITPTLS